MGRRRVRGWGPVWTAGALVAVGALAESRRRLRNWGATRAEAHEALRGDALLDEVAEQTTRAIDVAAPPAAVWPWLVQIGEGRGGFYTYAWVERALGGAGTRAESVDPDLQDLRAGDLVQVLPGSRVRSAHYYSVVDVDPGRALVLLSRRPSGAMVSWAFVVRPGLDGGSRVIARTRHARLRTPWLRALQWAEITLVAPMHALMERGMLLGLARRASGR